ncbi:hypothetical protein VTO42DRAFT_6205 [Malbranchea cinnamomea]
MPTLVLRASLRVVKERQAGLRKPTLFFQVTVAGGGSKFKPPREATLTWWDIVQTPCPQSPPTRGLLLGHPTGERRQETHGAVAYPPPARSSVAALPMTAATRLKSAWSPSTTCTARTTPRERVASSSRAMGPHAPRCGSVRRRHACCSHPQHRCHLFSARLQVQEVAGCHEGLPN